MRRRPYSVVLFDEVEKAHADVWNVLLQVLDDGRLTDGQGRTVDFKNTVIILTSNIGSHHIQAISDRQELRRRTGRAHRAGGHGRRAKRVPAGVPEPARRDRRLQPPRARATSRTIVDIQLGQFRERLGRRDLSLELTEGAKAYLAEVGWDPQYGARPLKRAIRKYLEDPMAKQVLAGQYPPGTTVQVDQDGVGGLTFRAKTLN